MSLGELVVLVVGGAVVLVAGYRLAKRFFSDEAKWERRRRRSHAPIASKSKRPMVKFSVHTKKGRRK